MLLVGVVDSGCWRSAEGDEIRLSGRWWWFLEVGAGFGVGFFDCCAWVLDCACAEDLSFG